MNLKVFQDTKESNKERETSKIVGVTLLFKPPVNRNCFLLFNDAPDWFSTDLWETHFIAYSEQQAVTVCKDNVANIKISKLARLSDVNYDT